MLNPAVPWHQAATVPDRVCWCYAATLPVSLRRDFVCALPLSHVRVTLKVRSVAIDKADNRCLYS